MKEVKTPKKPLLFYYAVALLVLFLFNLLAMPWLAEHQIKDVDYNTFVTMTENGEVGEVEIQQFDDTWVVEAPWLQRLMANVNFGDYESRNWFDQKLRQSGLFDKLEEMGIRDGDIVSMYDLEFEYQR